MKRNLIQNVKVLPGGVDTPVDRKGFLSAIVGANVTEAGELSISVEHCDTEDGTFEPVGDQFVLVGLVPVMKTVKVNGSDEIVFADAWKPIAVETGDIANIDVDLVGCRQFVKFISTGTAEADFAVALGDADFMPA